LADKVEDKEGRVEPAPLEVALLYKILEAQRETLTFIKDHTPEGVTEIVEKNVTTASVTTINFLREYPYRKLFSVLIVNKGPSDVWARINNDKEQLVEDGETIPFEKGKAIIEYASLRVETGSAEVRLVIKY